MMDYYDDPDPCPHCGKKFRKLSQDVKRDGSSRNRVQKSKGHCLQDAF